MKSDPEKTVVKRNKPSHFEIIRKIAILKILTMEPISLYRLADLMKVSVRTIQRDIEDLRSSGFPIVMNLENNLFQTVSDYAVPPIQFDFYEVLTLLVLLETGNVDSELYQADAARASMKLISMLPHEFFDFASALYADLEVLSGPEDFRAKKNDPLFTVSEALKEKRVLKIRYSSPALPGDIETTLHPYTIFYAHRGWYVIVFSGLYDEVRTYKVIRIQEIEKTEEKFSRPIGFSLSEYLGNAWLLIAEPGMDYEVVIKFSPKVAKNVAETRWHKTQEMKWLPDGYLEVRFHVASLAEIQYWILGYGAEAEVIAPDTLKKMIADHARKMLASYQEKN